MNVALPTGTVTFLFTDIESSTRLLRGHGTEYKRILADHRRVLRDAFERHRGVEVDTQGDAFFAAFADPSDAVAAAEDAQSRLEIPVRMGIHTGEPESTPDGYVGEDVHLGARIAAAAHGGQVVLSKAVGDLVDRPLTDLGEHRVKDFEEPVWIYQLGDEPFPPLKTISNTNLPRPASSFVGRRRETAEVVSLFRDGARFVTLTGPGGSGKTRLAIEVAGELVPAHRNGVFWVRLAPLRDPALVPTTIAGTLGAKDSLAKHIAERELLLLLDNFEQVVDAAPELASLIEDCRNLRLLVTSRELLRVRGEVEYAVHPLAEAEAVDLFCRRSRLAPDVAIAELCRRLDDLPLAVELAAARTSVLSPLQILERLSQRLDLLEGGRDADPRQQTLRAAIEWSYDLLNDEEQGLFAGLAVFRGGCTLEAAEVVCGAELDTLQSLVHKSLLGGTNERFSMLETIRELASERLQFSGEEDQAQRRHAKHFVRLAEDFEPELFSGDQACAVAWFSEELDNIRAALDWTRQEEPELELRLVAAVAHFWLLRAYWAEAGQWLDHALAGPTEPSSARAKALQEAALLARIQQNFPRAKSLALKGFALCLEHGDQGGAARCLNALTAVAGFEGDWEGARHLSARSRRLALSAGDGRTAAFARFTLADVALFVKRFDDARESGNEALQLFRDIQNSEGIALSLSIIGLAACEQGRRDEAHRALIEGLSVGADFVFPEPLSWCLDTAAALAPASESTARLLGAAERLRAGIPGRPTVERIHERTCLAVREKLSEDRFDLLCSEGRRLLPEQAVELALDLLR